MDYIIIWILPVDVTVQSCEPWLYLQELLKIRVTFGSSKDWENVSWNHTAN